MRGENGHKRTIPKKNNIDRASNGLPDNRHSLINTLSGDSLAKIQE